jgi:hypothetical protein
MRKAQLFWPVVLEDVTMINPSSNRRLFSDMKRCHQLIQMRRHVNT